MRVYTTYFMTVNAATRPVCDDQSTVPTLLFAPLACCRVLRVCALFEGLAEFCFVFDFVFVPLSWISRRYTFTTTGHMYKEFMRIFVANTVAHAHRQRVCVSQFS